MKLFSNEMELNAKTKLTFALCTALAMSVTSLPAADDKDQGGPGAVNKTQAGKSQLSPAAEKFVHEAATSGMMEVRLGKLGVQKAQHPQVKQFAQALVTEHTRINNELKQIAQNKGITLPDPDRIAGTQGQGQQGLGQRPGQAQGQEAQGAPGAQGEREPGRPQAGAQPGDQSAMHKEFAQTIQRLEGMSGTEFDQTFIKTAVTHHEKDVQQFEQASQTLDDPALKAFAAKTLPTLREHLMQAKNLHKQVGGAVGAPGADTGTQPGKVKTDDDRL